MNEPALLLRQRQEGGPAQEFDKMPMCGTFPAVQGLDFTFQCRGCRLDPWLGSQDPTCLLARKPEHKQQKQNCNKFNKDFESGPHQKNLKTNKQTKNL